MRRFRATRSRGGMAISIHAPQWGATRRRVCRTARGDISIHAPQWGATVHIRHILGQLVYFNPRTPVGCDRRHVTRIVPGGYISIHAPQWGATIYHCDNRESAADFNPRTPVGCDREQACPPSFRCYFNPRTPVGCDDFLESNTGSMSKFQSTHPSGVRPSGPERHNAVKSISIHAPQWGATGVWLPRHGT